MVLQIPNYKIRIRDLGAIMPPIKLQGVNMKEVKVVMLIITTLMLAWLLTDYNIFQYTFISDVFLIGLSICWIKCFDLVIKEEE